MIFGNGSRQIARLLLNYTPTNRCIIPLVGCSPPIFAAFSSPIQMNNREPALNRTEKATLIFTDIVFFGVAVAAALLNRLPPIPDWLFPLLVGLAAFRGGRAIAYNLIFHWLRDLFGVREVDDSSGAGKSNEATGHGIRRIIGELLCCPVCSATWVALGLLVIYVIYQPAGEIFTYALAAAGLGEVFEWLAEYLFWRGRQAREEAGSYWMLKNTPETLRDLYDRSKGNGPQI